MTDTADRARKTGPALEKCYQFVLWLIPTESVGVRVEFVI